MHGISTISIKQAKATVREYETARNTGNRKLANKIKKANPNLSDVFDASDLDFNNYLKGKR